MDSVESLFSWSLTFSYRLIRLILSPVSRGHYLVAIEHLASRSHSQSTAQRAFLY